MLGGQAKRAYKEMVATRLENIGDEVKSLARNQDELMQMMVRALSALDAAERARRDANTEAETANQLRMQVSELTEEVEVLRAQAALEDELAYERKRTRNNAAVASEQEKGAFETLTTTRLDELQGMDRRQLERLHLSTTAALCQALREHRARKNQVDALQVLLADKISSFNLRKHPLMVDHLENRGQQVSRTLHRARRRVRVCRAIFCLQVTGQIVTGSLHTSDVVIMQTTFCRTASQGWQLPGVAALQDLGTSMSDSMSDAQQG